MYIKTASQRMYESLKHQFFNGRCWFRFDEWGDPYLEYENYTNRDDCILFYHFHDLINHLINEGYDFLSLYSF